MSREITFLNGMGDVTITWQENEDERIKNLIQQKMDEGYVFFIVERKFLRNKKKKISKISELGNLRSVVLKDKTLEKLFTQKKIEIHNSDDNSDYETKKRMEKPEEIPTNSNKTEVVGMRRAVGG